MSRSSDEIEVAEARFTALMQGVPETIAPSGVWKAFYETLASVTWDEDAF